MDGVETVSSTSLTKTLQSPIDNIQYDNPFIVKYVAYHYYRSKAWVVKDGIKFGTDYSRLHCERKRIKSKVLMHETVLYQRGPAFHHGE